MAHHHFTPQERSEIAILLKKGYSYREIGYALGRSHTSIGREIRRNSTKKGYDPRSAKLKARVRRKQAKYQGMKIREHPELAAFIHQKITEGWTPERIAGRAEKEDLPSVSTKGIYKYLETAFGHAYCMYLPRKRPWRRRRYAVHGGREMIPQRVGIEKRPEDVDTRSLFGHYEGDTMVSGKKTGSKVALSVLIERKTRYVQLRKISSLKPQENACAIQRMMNTLSVVHSITFDNGIENKQHTDLGIPTYFCDPYSSWQKGSVENVIGLVRRFIPKGADISQYSDETISLIQDWLNDLPRTCLNFRTPREVFADYVTLLPSTKNLSGAFQG